MTNNLPQRVKDFLSDLKTHAPELGEQIENICLLCYAVGDRDGFRQAKQIVEANRLADALPGEYVQYAESLVKEWDSGKFN